MSERDEFEAIARRTGILAKVAFAASGLLILASFVREFVNVFLLHYIAGYPPMTWNSIIEEEPGFLRRALEILALFMARGIAPALIVSLIAVIAIVITRRAAADNTFFSAVLEKDFARRARLFAVVAEIYAWVYLAFAAGMQVVSGAAMGLWFRNSSIVGAGNVLETTVRQLSWSAQQLVSSLLTFTAILLAALVVKALAGTPENTFEQPRPETGVSDGN